MCGRVVQKSGLGLAIIAGTDTADPSVRQFRARYNGAPRQELLIIRRHPETGLPIMSAARWGLIHHSFSDQDPPAQQPINARAETVKSKPTFADAYRKRRCILPVDGFFEWKAIKGAKAKQPYAISMADGRPFGVAGLWENWRNPRTNHWVRTFCVLTCPANELVSQIHDRMPVILGEAFYMRWLDEQPEADELLKQFPADLMVMWPVSQRVSNVGNDDANLVEPVPPAAEQTTEELL
jgi:putative SOS response-associated peptidase YedK